MRIIKIILFSLLALSLIACTGIFIFFQTFDTDQYLPQIVKKASLALGRPVSIGHVGLGFSARGITLDAGPVAVADDADFTSQPFIKIDRVCISLDLKSLILRRKIHITGILLQSPQIHFIRSQEGNFNIHSIGQASQLVGDKTAAPTPPHGAVISSPVIVKINGALPAGRQESHNTIKLITIQDASISFIDQSQAMPLDIWLTNINAGLNDSSLSQRSVRISGLELKVDLSQLDVKDISPEIPDSPVFKHIAGVVQLNMQNLEIGSSAGFAANGDISITGGVIKNFNIIKTVLSHTLGSFGGMEGDIDNLLNGQLKEKLGTQDTVIEKGMAQFSFHDKTVFIDDSLIETNIFEFKAQGSMDQGLNMDMQTMLHLNGDVSAALVNELDGLKYLMDGSKRIAIGANLKGVIPHLKYKLDKDFRKKSKKMLMEEGGNILGVFLGGGQTSGNPKKKFKNMLKTFLQ